MSTKKSKVLVVFIGDYMEINIVNDGGKSVVDVFEKFRADGVYCKGLLNVDSDEENDWMDSWLTTGQIEELIDNMCFRGYYFGDSDIYVVGDQSYLIIKCSDLK